MAYSDKVLDHYENPRNVGKMDPADETVGTGMVGAPACGDVTLKEYDIEQNSEEATKFAIRGVPTLVLLKDGVEVKRKSGVLMADQIEEFIRD